MGAVRTSGDRIKCVCGEKAAAKAKQRRKGKKDMYS
jgi:hypothetical protein